MPSPFWLSKGAIPLTTAQVAMLTEEQAWSYLVELRWGSEGKQICPECGVEDKHYFLRTRKQWRCKHCNHTFSVTSKTAFADRKLPFHDILLGLFLFLAGQKGLAALELRRHVGHTYKTCFAFLGKVRDAIRKTVDQTPLSGNIEMDGAHLSGWPRKGRKIAPPKQDPEVPKKYAAKKTESSEAINDAPEAQHRKIRTKRHRGFHPNRRIVWVACETTDTKGRGSVRTRTAIIHRETAAEIEALTQQMVAKGSRIWTDELPAYKSLPLYGYTHEAVNHSIEFSTDDGVNENQAESFFSRLRRAEEGIYHRITPHYMADYVAECSWREDVRRMNTQEQIVNLAKRVFRAGVSQDWRGYNRGHHRKDEILFWIGDDPREQKTQSPTQSQ